MKTMMTCLSRFANRAFKNRIRLVLALMMGSCCALPAWAAQLATTTALTVSSTTIPYQTPVTLTATVTAGGSPVTTGLVLFCDATAPVCENNSALALRQVNSTTGTVAFKTGSGAVGNHSYKAVYRANNGYLSSVSNTVTYAVQGGYSSTISLSTGGTVGNYTLASTVVGLGSLASGPTGNVQYIDTSAGNSILATQALGPAVLSQNYQQAPNSPFAIGTPDPNATPLNPDRSVAIASAYLNTDNNLDVVTGDKLQTISVLLGNGDGSFQPKVNYSGCPQGVALKILLADFNRDGNTDVALGCSNGTTGGLVILLGNGDGTFRSPTEYVSGDVNGIAMGDFNGDGILDFVVTDRTQVDVTLFLGNGDGTFQSGVKIESPSAKPSNIVVADFNGDGKDDIVFAVDNTTNVGNGFLSDLYAALGNGDGTFAAPTKVASNVGEFLTVGDTNADGLFDIVSTTIMYSSHIANNLWVLLGKGNGTFQTPVSYISDIPSDPHLADVNGDGKADIIAGGSTGALVYLGNGDGTLQPYNEPTIGGFSLTYAVNAGDYNNDGNADLIGTDAKNPQAAVALSQVLQTANAAALTGLAVYPLGSGTHTVDASYAGDTAYTGSTSATTNLLAAPTPTTLTLSTTPSTGPLVSGQPTLLSASLSPYTVGPPTTTTDGETVLFFNGSTSLGTGTLHSGVATLTTSAIPAGTAQLKASFAGDSNYNSSVSNVVSLSVTPILLTSSLDPSTYLQSVTFTATVASSATGTITFLDGATALSVVNVTNGVATYTTSSLSAGLHPITAAYSGDSTHAAVTSTVLSQTVNQARPTVTVSTSGPSTYGNAVTLTATLSQNATGTVTFTSGSTTLGSATLNGSAVATLSVSSLPAGSDTITATYPGDTNYTSGTGSTVQSVAKATPVLPAPGYSPSSPTVFQTVTLTEAVPTGVSGPVTFLNGSTSLGTAAVNGSGIATLVVGPLALGNNSITATTPGDSNNNPASSPASVVTVVKATPTVAVTTSGPSTYGSSVTLSATVTTGATGTVVFTSGSTTLGTATVNGSSVASLSTSVLPVGSDPITATYSGDTNYNGASGSTTQQVSKATPTVAVTTSGPSIYGTSVTLSATVTTGATGTVVFTSGSTTLGTATVNGSGLASLSTTVLPVGSDPITATYSGDTNYTSASGSTTQQVSKATPTMSVTTSGPSAYGGAVTVTATLPSTATGTVVFTSGSTTLGTATVNGSGVATISTSSLPVGSDPISATYSGDANYNSASGSTTQQVSKATPTVSVTTSGPSTYGGAVTVTATVPAGATGTVVFTSGSTTLGTGTVNSSGVATISTSSLPAGSNTITATYSGDTNYNTASGSTSQSVAKATPPVTVSTSGTSTYGGTVTVTATLPAGPTGTVTFSSGGTTLGTGTVNSSGVATISTSSLPAGNNPITATYSGDSNYTGATGTATQVVNKATPTSTLTSSLNPSVFGNTVTLTDTLPTSVTGTVTFSSGTTTLATVPVTNGVATYTVSTLPTGGNPIVATYSGDTNDSSVTASLNQVVNKASPPVTVTTSGPSTYGGTVTVTATVQPGATGTVVFTSGSTTLGTGTLNSSGSVSITTSTLPTGNDTITATYSGDTNDNGGSGTVVQSVAKASPTVTLTSSSNPSTTLQQVTFTATVPTTATGTVTFTDGSTVLGTSTITNGVATVSVPTLSSGSHSVTATYSGDTNDNGASSTPLTQVVNKNTPVLPAPTVSSTSIAPGQQETITEQVPSGVTGPVSFFNGATLLGTSPIVNGVATLTTSTLPIGTATITASTPADTNNNAAVSPATQVTVAKITPTITLTTSSNPAVLNQSVTLTATVNAGATGTVSFYDGSTLLGTGAVSSAGVASFNTSGLSVGGHSITAVYSGDSTYNTATSAALSQQIGKLPTSVVVTASTPAELLGTSVTFTATVAANSPTPTGTVTFFDGAAALASAPLSTNGSVVVSLATSGSAVYSTSSLTAGSHQITAVYSGDSSFAASTSPIVTNIVQDFTVTPKGSLSQSVFPGDTTTYTFTVAPVGGTTFLADLSFAIDGVPTGVTYTITPAKITAGSGATDVTLSVVTSSSLSASNRQPVQPGSDRSALPMAAGLLGLLGLGALRRYRRTMPRLLAVLLLLAASMLPVLGLSGCAGGYFALSPKTYSITVTGTEGTLQHSASATLVVQ
ncbi:MAG: Ig-like domain repeat protein [Acidobacteriota bacterium]|nr:Ig-like domain repeat protein [Acidobacteriota bacterium]